MSSSPSHQLAVFFEVKCIERRLAKFSKQSQVKVTNVDLYVRSVFTGSFFFMIFKRKTHIDVLYVDEKLFWWTPRLKSSHVTQEASSCGEIKAQPHKKQFTFTTPNMNYSHLSYSPPVLLPFTDRKLSQSFLACNIPELQNSVPFIVERLTISSMPRKASSIVWL